MLVVQFYLNIIPNYLRIIPNTNSKHHITNVPQKKIEEIKNRNDLTFYTFKNKFFSPQAIYRVYTNLIIHQCWSIVRKF